MLNTNVREPNEKEQFSMVNEKGHLKGSIVSGRDSYEPEDKELLEKEAIEELKFFIENNDQGKRFSAGFLLNNLFRSDSHFHDEINDMAMTMMAVSAVLNHPGINALFHKIAPELADDLGDRLRRLVLFLLALDNNNTAYAEIDLGPLAMEFEEDRNTLIYLIKEYKGKNAAIRKRNHAL